MPGAMHFATLGSPSNRATHRRAAVGGRDIRARHHDRADGGSNRDRHRRPRHSPRPAEGPTGCHVSARLTCGPNGYFNNPGTDLDYASLAVIVVSYKTKTVESQTGRDRCCLTGISQTGTVGLSLWMTRLFVLVLRVSPSNASFLVIWVGAISIFGRLFCSWISDAMGRRHAVVLSCLIAAVTMSLAGT